MREVVNLDDYRTAKVDGQVAHDEKVMGNHPDYRAKMRRERAAQERTMKTPAEQLDYVRQLHLISDMALRRSGITKPRDIDQVIDSFDSDEPFNK